METLALESGFPKNCLDLSEEFMVDICSLMYNPECLCYLCPDPGDCKGGYIGKAAEFLRNCGIPEEWCREYDKKDYLNCVQTSCSDVNSSLYNAIVLSIQVQRAKGQPEEVIEHFIVQEEGDYFINLTNGDSLNKDTAVSSAEINLIGYGQLFGPNDFNKNVFQLKKQVHLIPGDYEISAILRSQPDSYLTIVISNRDISSFQDLP